MSYLSHLAEKWVDRRDPTLLAPFESLSKENAALFLTRWHKTKNLRRMYLMGLNNKEIRESGMSCDELYSRCIGNALTIPSIEIKKAIEIMGRDNRKPTSEQVRCGQILRYVVETCGNRGWVGVPSRIILKTFPDYGKYFDMLRDEYNLVGDYHTVYLKKNDNIERRVSQFIVEFLENNEPFISDPVFSGDIKLTPKQKEAIKVSLHKGISVITDVAFPVKEQRT